MASKSGAQRGFLTRLLHDRAGNTLVITAAATLPLLALVGGGIDVSRLYLVKTRLQQACDAGALAGRKSQGGGVWDATSQKAANDIFNANFVEHAYGTGALTKSYNENSGTVAGSASVPVPMLIMRIFGFDQKILSVSCDAEMRLPNTDIMFVLDTTGSMGDPPTSGGSTSKLSGLKTAVQCFYEILMKIDTPASCGSTPSGGISEDIQVRFGFVPYAVNVNVGKLLPNEFLADNWTYQSREPSLSTIWTWSPGTESAITGWSNWSSAPNNITDINSFSGWSTVSSNNVTVNGTRYSRYPGSANSNSCTGLNTNGGGVGIVDSGNLDLQSTGNSPPTYPASQQTLTYSQSDTHTVTAYKYVWDSGAKNNKCRLQDATRSYTLTRTGGQSTRPITWTSYQRLDSWTYKPRSLDVSGLKAGGSTWNNSVTLPLGSGSSVSVRPEGSNTESWITPFADRSVNWDGCIEERQTVRTTNFSPVPADAYDLDIDMKPSNGNAATQWGPMLPDAVWGRYTGTRTSNRSYDAVTTSSDLSTNRSASCPTESRLLKEYRTSTETSDFVSYVNSLRDSGNTYHDIGLLWGARLMSPTGIFSADNAFTPKGGEIQRHLIFMTDGDACTSVTNYTAYGISWWDRRQTSESSAPSDGCTATGTLTEQVNLRTQAICAAIKNMNVTLWVVNYGGGVTTTTGELLSKCASTSRYYEATSVTDLLTTFQQIAAQISQLRLTQ